MLMANCFSISYAEARNRFLTIATQKSAEITAYKYPKLGPEDEELYVDVARLGSPRPERALIIISGTHGVEGFAGSACQSAWLDAYTEGQLDPLSAVYLVHSLNPFGFAW